MNETMILIATRLEPDGMYSAGNPIKLVTGETVILIFRRLAKPFWMKSIMLSLFDDLLSEKADRS